MLSIDEVLELADALVKQYESARRNRSVLLDPVEMKRPDVLSQLADWRAKKLIMPFMGIPSAIQCTHEGYLHFRDLVNAHRVMPKV